MFIVNDLKIEMTEGDYGITLPITLVTDDELITSDDSFSIKIFSEINGEPLVSKSYTDIQDNTIEFSLTEEETLLLPVGEYYYDLDWYQNGIFMDNLIAKEFYGVIEKAGKVGGNNGS